MKKILIVIILIIGFQQVDAQSDTTPVYKRFPVIPQFTIMTAPDSIKFTKDDLKKRKETLIILFSPDCSHCKVAVKELLEKIDLFKKIQIVLVSSLNFDHIKNFYEEYKLAAYPNITVGRDAAYYLGTFYKLRNFPSMYLYDKKGDFVQEFLGDVKMESIAAAL